MPETNFFWDPLSDNILQERDETGTVTAEYTTEPGLYGNLINQNRQGIESQYHFDALGSALALTDDNQQVTDTNAYTAFGETTENSGSTVNVLQYVGQKGYRHLGSGNYSIRSRSFSTLNGRFMSVDAIGYDAWLNHYVYVRDCPVAFIDPGGRQPNASLYAFLPRIKIQRATITPCVNAECGVKFLLPPPSIVSSGFVVQEIEVSTSIRDCDGKDVTSMFTDRPYVHYWEAFDIANIRFRANVDDPDDNFLWKGDFEGTTGSRTVTGIAKGAGNVPLPDEFTDAIGVPEAGTLPVTVNRPFGWDQLPGTPHDMSVSWDCCCPSYCALMRTVPKWAIEISVGPGASPSCPKQIPIYKDIK